MFDRNLIKLTEFLKKNNLTVSTAESCTGGLLSSRLTDVSGSSSFIKLNFVTYAYEAKEEILFIDKEFLEKYTAVSPECAKAMAEGLHKRTGCDLAICTTGIAGPTGGSKTKPVGLVYVSALYNGKLSVKEFRLPSFLPRKLMKFCFTQKAIDTALELILQ
ncbi:CinA family protein [Spirochaetes bacterium]|uniref:CinA family protein n=1 Tax=Candidatus Scatousia excrementipullorum TaxID=2840936 RepID=A0A9D9DRP9_9BACT|nr:CinA family protein [Candidatus Scatousia excrementipullorum]